MKRTLRTRGITVNRDLTTFEIIAYWLAFSIGVCWRLRFVIAAVLAYWALVVTGVI